ncbi:hypothetical protein HYU19_04250 [Candidatus Woesearchaeota archaeon]|nr:hypothetical protein [Candidatus Woesearchaeota archaeon]
MARDQFKSRRGGSDRGAGGYRRQEGSDDVVGRIQKDFSNRFSDGPRPPRESHKATCSDCGNECDVPFKPTEGRPVYCKACFPKHRKPREW